MTMFEDDKRFKAVEMESHREDLFRNYLVDLQKKEKAKAQEEHRRNRLEFKQFLESCGFIKRVALSTAANMCKKLPSDSADFVMEAVPLFTNLLQYHDAKVLESASICLTRIAEAFVSSQEKLHELCNHGLVTQAAALVSSSNSGGGQVSLSSSTFTGQSPYFSLESVAFLKKYYQGLACPLLLH